MHQSSNTSIAQPTTYYILTPTDLYVRFPFIPLLLLSYLSSDMRHPRKPAKPIHNAGAGRVAETEPIDLITESEDDDDYDDEGPAGIEEDDEASDDHEEQQAATKTTRYAMTDDASRQGFIHTIYSLSCMSALIIKHT